jgi:hypothetical protein
MAHSLGYLLGGVFVTELQALATGLGVHFMDNPPLPLDTTTMPSGVDRVLFVIQRGDVLEDQPGQERERRRLRLVVGAASFALDARGPADELHFGARDRCKSRSFRAALAAVTPVTELREAELEPQLQDMASAGAVLLSAYEIQYIQTYPSFDL